MGHHCCIPLCVRTPFGREYEVTAKTKYNVHKVEDVHNHFMIVSGNMEEEISKLDTK